jgi:hypothetical protein
MIELQETSAFRLRGPFTAIQQPLREKADWPDWPIMEKQIGSVTWHAAIEILPGVNPAKVTVKGVVRAQVDTASYCLMPTSYPFVATFRASDCRR